MSAVDVHAEQILLTPAEALAAVTAWELQGTLLALALRRIETSGAFGVDGSVSMKAWLRDHARMTDQGAGDLLATGRFLDNNAAFAEAAVTGQLSGGQVSVVKRLGRPKYAALRRHHTYVHSQFLNVKLLPDATAHFTWTDGRERTSHPRGAPPTRPPG